MPRPETILQVLDEAAQSYVVPMLDNGYVYLAATRLSLFWSPAEWSMVFEVFGYSPRAGLPDLGVWTIASTIANRKAQGDFVSPAAHAAYLAAHRHDDARFFYPVEEGTWQDQEDDELVALGAVEVSLRGRTVPIPTAKELHAAGISVDEPARLRVFELCRFFAARHREFVLATDAERRANTPADLVELIRLDDWIHPDLAAGERPSQMESFQQLAAVLATGDASQYRPTRPGNTHWKNWPEGGTL